GKQGSGDRGLRSLFSGLALSDGGLFLGLFRQWSTAGHGRGNDGKTYPLTTTQAPKFRLHGRNLLESSSESRPRPAASRPASFWLTDPDGRRSPEWRRSGSSYRSAAREPPGCATARIDESRHPDRTHEWKRCHLRTSADADESSAESRHHMHPRSASAV